MEKYIIYLRVSTKKQGNSGLGLEAQRTICYDHVAKMNGEVLAEYKDIITGSKDTRKGLLDAISRANSEDATLVIAKLDRFARDTEFSFRVRKTGIKLYFCDMPVMNTLQFGMQSVFGEYEREEGTRRTKAALGVIKGAIAEQGVYTTRKGRDITSLGNPNIKDVQIQGALASAEKRRAERDTSEEWIQAKQWATMLRSEGKSYEYIAEQLNATGTLTRKGGLWSKGSVYRLLNG